MSQEQTEHLHLPLPDPGSTLEHDVLGLVMAYVMIDIAIHELGQDVATRATAQALETALQGVTAALAIKASVAQLQAVDQAQTNALQALGVTTAQELQLLRQSIDSKAIDLGTVLQASTQAQAIAGLQKLGVKRKKHADSATDGQALEPGVEYSVYTDVPYSRTLPPNPQHGDTIVLLDTWGLWKRGVFTVRRGNLAHTINTRQEDFLVNRNCWRLTFQYVWDNAWTATAG